MFRLCFPKGFNCLNRWLMSIPFLGFAESAHNLLNGPQEQLRSCRLFRYSLANAHITTIYHTFGFCVDVPYLIVKEGFMLYSSARFRLCSRSPCFGARTGGPGKSRRTRHSRPPTGFRASLRKPSSTALSEAWTFRSKGLAFYTGRADALLIVVGHEWDLLRLAALDKIGGTQPNIAAPKFRSTQR